MNTLREVSSNAFISPTNFSSSQAEYTVDDFSIASQIATADDVVINTESIVVKDSLSMILI